MNTKRAIETPALKQGDLLFVTLTGSKLKNYRGTPTTGVGWLLVHEVSVDGEIINANFCPQDGARQLADGTNIPGGYGQVIWPEHITHAFVRGHHGECSPWTALMMMFNKSAAICLT